MARTTTRASTAWDTRGGRLLNAMGELAFRKIGQTLGSIIPEEKIRAFDAQIPGGGLTVDVILTLITVFVQMLPPGIGELLEGVFQGFGQRISQRRANFPADQNAQFQWVKDQAAEFFAGWNPPAASKRKESYYTSYANLSTSQRSPIDEVVRLYRDATATAEELQQKLDAIADLAARAQENARLRPYVGHPLAKDPLKNANVMEIRHDELRAVAEISELHSRAYAFGKLMVPAPSQAESMIGTARKVLKDALKAVDDMASSESLKNLGQHADDYVARAEARRAITSHVDQPRVEDAKKAAAQAIADVRSAQPQPQPQQPPGRWSRFIDRLTGPLKNNRS